MVKLIVGEWQAFFQVLSITFISIKTQLFRKIRVYQLISLHFSVRSLLKTINVTIHLLQGWSKAKNCGL